MAQEAGRGNFCLFGLTAQKGAEAATGTTSTGNTTMNRKTRADTLD